MLVVQKREAPEENGCSGPGCYMMLFKISLDGSRLLHHDAGKQGGEVLIALVVSHLVELVSSSKSKHRP